jgi:hypothetical protein
MAAMRRRVWPGIEPQQQKIRKAKTLACMVFIAQHGTEPQKIGQVPEVDTSGVKVPLEVAHLVVVLCV